MLFLATEKKLSTCTKLWLTLSLSIFACCIVSAKTMASNTFNPVSTACVKMANGTPKLLINGKSVLPLIFFPNTDILGEWSRKSLQDQVKLASKTGVHIYSFPFRIMTSPSTRNPDYSRGENDIQTIIKNDPQAVFLLRMFLRPSTTVSDWPEIPKTDVSVFADGSTNFISIASDLYWKLSNKELAEAIHHLESGRFGNRIMGYHASGPECEMFMDSYREKGPEYSAANQLGFRRWLKNKYKTNMALQNAWKRDDITIETAGIPSFEPGRFPIHRAGQNEKMEIFYNADKEQDWIDYSHYCSDLSSDRVIEMAKTIKEATSGRKLTAFFYGYTFDLIGSFSGHNRLNKVLDCRDIDILASPYSYEGRLGGEPGGFMSPVDSIIAHGKLWFNEDDTRTSLVDVSKLSAQSALWCGLRASDLNESIAMLERNFGALLTHRTGTWWMDLLGAGAYNHPDIWKTIKKRAPLLTEIQKHPTPYRPEVGLIVDEESRAVVKNDFNESKDLRDQAMKSGASVGFYTLSDFIIGVVPKCKVYVFPNSYILTNAQVIQINARLDREKATAIWLYFAGCFGPKGFDTSLAERVTGLKLKSSDGIQGSSGNGPLAGQNWGWTGSIVSRPVVDDTPNAEILGRYTSDGLVSSASKVVGNHRNIVVGDLAVTPAILRILFAKAGVHIWTSGNEIIQTDGRFLMIHRGLKGLVRVSIPAGTKAEVISGNVVKCDKSNITLQFRKNSTAWLRLCRRSGCKSLSSSKTPSVLKSGWIR